MTGHNIWYLESQVLASMAAAETLAKLFEKLQEDTANRIAVKLEALTDKIEDNHSQVNHSISALDKKCDVLSSAIEMLSLQVSRAVEIMELYSKKDRPILGSAEQQFQQGNFIATPSQTPASLGNKVEVENVSSYAVRACSYQFDFPRFDGSNLRSWLLKSLCYFKLMNVSDGDKVAIAVIHLDGEAMEWFCQIYQEDRHISWEHFVDLVSDRFGESEIRIFTEFRKLEVKGSLEDYIDKFLELKSHLMMFRKGAYDERFFVNSFISGLTEEMRQCFFINVPQTLKQTIQTARMHEAIMEGAATRIRALSSQEEEVEVS